MSDSSRKLPPQPTIFDVVDRSPSQAPVRSGASGVRLPGRGVTRDAARQVSGERRVSEAFEGQRRAALPLPVIKGQAAEALRRAPARAVHRDQGLEFGQPEADFDFESDDERGVVALACVLLEQVRRHGGTVAPSRTLVPVLRRLMATLSEEEMMALEVETYEIMAWLDRSLGQGQEVVVEAQPDEVPKVTRGQRPERSVTSMIRRAIEARRDVTIQYFTGGRAELTQRQVTPLRIEAEKYLHAYCHKRQDDRVFRLNRIRQVSWVGGPPMLDNRPPVHEPLARPPVRKPAPMPVRKASVNDPQMSLLPSGSKKS